MYKIRSKKEHWSKEKSEQDEKKEKENTHRGNSANGPVYWPL
jgi:hypothetical protein